MESNILGIETSGKICSVALYKDNIFKEINLNSGLTHSETLFLNVDKLLNDNFIKVKDISYIAVSNGPGSYTGLRIGISCALGLSIVDNISIRFVNTLKSLNYNACSYFEDNNINCNPNDIIVSILDAKANRVYLGISYYTSIDCFVVERIVTIDELISILKSFDSNIYIIGDGVEIYKDIINNDEFKTKIDFLPNKYNELNAKNIIIASHFKNNYIEKLDINYMQKSQAERNRINNV